MPNIFIILGDANTRKSSTVRALTGIAKRGVYRVAIAHGDDIQVFVQVVACQEEPISPKDFVKRVTKENCTNVLVSLRVKHLRVKQRKQPGGDAYIQRFLRERWSIGGIVVLGREKLPVPYNLPEELHGATRCIPGSRNMPANEIASKIREWWQWL